MSTDRDNNTKASKLENGGNRVDTQLISVNPTFTEKEIQSYGLHLMSSMGQNNHFPCHILTEDINNHTYDYALQETPWIIKQDILHDKNGRYCGIRGLISSIKEINKNIFADYIAKNNISLSEDDLANKCADHFVDLFNKEEEKHKLIRLIFDFEEGSEGAVRRTIDLGLKSSDGTSTPELRYNVFYPEKLNAFSYKNSFYHIREKRLQDKKCLEKTEKSHERADFVTYVNGIPFILHEYKTLKSGLLKGVIDMRDKPSYQKIPLVFVTDGVNAALLSNPYQINQNDGATNIPLYLWTNYTGKKSTLSNGEERDQTGLENIVDNLLSNYENLYLYLKHCLIVDGDIVKLARVQQFNAVLAFKNELNTLLASPKEKRERVNLGVLHTQRSGKTMTMRMMVHVLMNCDGAIYKELFSTVFLYAPDLTILKVLTTEFDHLAGGGNKEGNKQNYIKIESRSRYIQVINDIKKSHENRKSGKSSKVSQNIYIVNMQKITDENVPRKNKKGEPIVEEKNKKKSNTYLFGEDVLNIIDEGHVGQTGSMAQLRDQNLPLSSNVIFTATPKQVTFSAYLGSEKGTILDTFTYTKAVEADITIPVIFHKAQKNIVKQNPSKKIGWHENGVTVNKLATDIQEALFLKMKEEMFTDINERENLSPEEEKNIHDKVNSETHAKMVRDVLWDHLDKSMMDEKIDYIVNFQRQVRNSLFVPNKDERRLSFNPKGICFGRDQKTIEAIIRHIQDKNIQSLDVNNLPACVLSLTDKNTVKDLLDQYEQASDQVVEPETKKPKEHSGEQGPPIPPPKSPKEKAREKLLEVINIQGHMNDLASSDGVLWRFALDHSNLDEKSCCYYNGGHIKIIIDPEGKKTSNIDTFFKEKTKPSNNNYIDILLAVDKYTKGYDLPELTTVFLNRNIAEISLMNQIFTRPATKRENKNTGYCVDLMFGEKNFDTFMMSMKAYNTQEDMNNLVLSDDHAEEIIKNVQEQIKSLCALANVSSSSELSYSVLLEGIGGTNEKMSDDVTSKHLRFAEIGKKIFNQIQKIRAVVYLQEEKRVLTIVYDVFTELRKSYANKVIGKTHNVDINIRENFGINQQETPCILDLALKRKKVREIVDEIVGVIKPGNGLAALLDLRYDDIASLPKYEREKQQKLIDEATKNRRSNQRFSMVKETSDVAKRLSLTELSERIDRFIERITAYPHLLYTKESDETMLELIKVSTDAKMAEINLIKENNQSTLSYFIKEGLVRAVKNINQENFSSDILLVLQKMADKTDYEISRRAKETGILTVEDKISLYKHLVGTNVIPQIYDIVSDLFKENKLNPNSLTPYASFLKNEGDHKNEVIHIVTDAIAEDDFISTSYKVTHIDV